MSNLNTIDELKGLSSKNSQLNSIEELRGLTAGSQNPQQTWGQRLSQIPQNLAISGAHEVLSQANMFPNLSSLMNEPEPVKNYRKAIQDLLVNPLENRYEKIKNTPEAWAAFATPIAVGVGGLAKGGIAAGKALSRQLPATKAVKSAEEMVESLIGQNKLSNLHEPVANEIRENESLIRGKEKGLWQDVKSAANSLGYKGEQEGISKALGVKGNRLSIESPKTLDKLEDIDVRDSHLKKAIENYKNLPSYENAHSLQSRLRQVGDEFSRSQDSAQRGIGRELNSARGSLLDSIEDTFKKNGHEELLDKLKKARNFTYKEAVPYTKNRSINAIVKKQGIEEVNPENIHNTLSGDAKAVRKVVSDLSPQAKNLILASKLKPAITETETMGRFVDPNKLLEKLNEIKKGQFEKFLTPEHKKVISNLEKQQKLSKRLKTGLKIAGGVGAGAIGIDELNRLRHLIGD